MTEIDTHRHEQYELVTLRALSRLRHLYQQMVGGHVHGQDGITRIADGILSPVIMGLEDLAEKMHRNSRPDMDLTDFPHPLLTVLHPE